MRVLGLRLASLGLLAAAVQSRELAEIELPRALHSVADSTKWPVSRLVVNVNKKGEFLIDRIDVAFGQVFVADVWKLKSKLIKVEAKALAEHLNQARRFHDEIRQAAPPEWPEAPHVVLRLDRNAPWGSLDALFPILIKEKLYDVRFAVRLGKKHGVLRTQLLAKVPPKAETLTVKIAEKGVDPAAFKEQLDAYVAKHKNKRLVAFRML